MSLLLATRYFAPALCISFAPSSLPPYKRTPGNAADDYDDEEVAGSCSGLLATPSCKARGEQSAIACLQSTALFLLAGLQAITDPTEIQGPDKRRLLELPGGGVLITACMFQANEGH